MKRDREEDIADLREYFECTCDILVEYYEDTKYCDNDCGCNILLSDYKHDPSCIYYQKSISKC